MISIFDKGPKFSEDGTLFYYDGLWHFRFPDKETLDYWLRVYDEDSDEYLREIIIGRVKITEKYLSTISWDKRRAWDEIKDETLITLNKMMARWWK